MLCLRQRCPWKLLPRAPVSIEPVLLKQRYRLLAQVGAGGFGAVYRAEDSQLGNRPVAVKEMSQRGLTPEEAQEATQAFRNEALLLAGLTHPNLPRIYEQFEEDGHWYLVMDFIEGETLETRSEPCAWRALASAGSAAAWRAACWCWTTCTPASRRSSFVT